MKTTGPIWIVVVAALVSACGRPAVAATVSPATPAPTVAEPTVAPSSSATVPPAASATPTPDPAVAVIEAYLAARIRVDTATVEALACDAWKAQARTESASFRSMNAELVDVTCSAVGVDGSATLVQCGGKIVTHYGGATRDWPQERFVYRVVNEDNALKMCGYK